VQSAPNTVPRQIVSKTIVIAIDTNERTMDALALGRLLADSTGAPVALLTVFPQVPLLDSAEPEMVRLRDELRESLSGLAREVGFADPAAEVVSGNFAARELQHVSERADTGLIVVGSTMRGPIGRLLVGGVGERLLAGAASPVAFAPRGYGDAPPSRLRRIGVGLDGSEEAQRALDAAVALAGRAEAEIHVITAFQRLAFGGVTTTALPSASANAAMRAELRAIHDKALATVGESVEAEGRFRDGSADDVLLEESEHLDLLVVGSRGYGPRGAVLMGSASGALARGGACPILVTPRGTRFDLLG
jgi:nucleotide-binding universal stress UspA family protein